MSFQAPGQVWEPDSKDQRDQLGGIWPTKLFGDLARTMMLEAVYWVFEGDVGRLLITFLHTLLAPLLAKVEKMIFNSCISQFCWL